MLTAALTGAPSDAKLRTANASSLRGTLSLYGAPEGGFGYSIGGDPPPPDGSYISTYNVWARLETVVRFPRKNGGISESQPRLSPDGSKIVYAETGPDGFNVDVYVMNADGSNPVNLSNYPSDPDAISACGRNGSYGQVDPIWRCVDTSPSWSPDGQHIAFVSGRSGHPEIYVMKADGSDLMLLTSRLSSLPDYGGSSGQPVWSPDGTKIAYSFPDDVQHFSYGWIAFRSNVAVLTLDQDPSGRFVVTSDDQLTFSPTRYVYNGSPAWSPDGSQIAFRYSNLNVNNGEPPIIDLHVMRTDGSHTVTYQTDTAGEFEDLPVWSPDGSQIAVASTAYGDERDPYGATRVFVLDLNSSTRTLIQTQAYNTYVYSWIDPCNPPARSLAKATLTDAALTDAAGTVRCIKEIVVNVTTDEPDTDPTDGFCDSDATQAGNQCTLRAAIQEANARAGADLITFDIPGGGLKTIAPATPLPPITEQVAIDGTTQPGYSTTPLIELRGDQAPTGTIGLWVQTNSSRISGLAVHSFFGQILIHNPQGSANGNLIERCFLGIFADGMTAPDLDPSRQQVFGVGITGDSQSNTIGGSFADAGNVISNCTTASIGIADPGAQLNRVLNNKIGTNKDGTASLTHVAPDAGVKIANGASQNVIGGKLGDEGNLISVGSAGVLLDNAQSNRIRGNLIGTDITGNAALGQAAGNNYGIQLLNGSKQNTIGGSAAQRNIISNNFSGIDIAEGGNTGNTVVGNYIGITRNGVAALKNVFYGVAVRSDDNTIGNNARAPNVISANGRANVFVRPKNGQGTVRGTTISDNYIGTNAGGAALSPQPEQFSGIALQDDVQNTFINDNVISGHEATTLGGQGFQDAGFGVLIANGPTNVSVENNFIGTDVTGYKAIKNAIGIGVVRASNVSITDNVISGNTFGVTLGEGIGLVEGEGNPGATVFTENVTLHGNLIGTTYDGNTAIVPSLKGIGIVIGKNARNNLIGGSSRASEGNTLSGLEDALFIGTFSQNPTFGEIPSGNRIQGNRIGLQAYAGRCLPNKTGITLVYSVDNLIGTEDESLAADLGNVIGCNGTGIETIGGIVERNSLAFNRIGDVSGAKENVGNTGDGMLLNGAKQTKVVGNTISNNGGHGVLLTNGASQTTLGGPAPGAGNTVNNNGGNGVRVNESAGNGNLIDPNKIFGNGRLGIDIGASGPAPNDFGDADEGPNRQQNYPEITGYTINQNNELLVSYRLTSAPGNSDYGTQGIYIEFFRADPGGEGQRFLGFDHYTVADYNNGSPIVKEINLGPVAALQFGANDRVTATATDAEGNTSEFFGDTDELPPPVITNFLPRQGVVGSTVTIYGAGFATTNAVGFNGISATFAVESATEILATVPAGATTGLISVTTSYGTGTSTSAYTVLADSDNDGMPDTFEQQYFGSATGGDPAGDNDGDGTSNLAEYRAGTSPTDPTSVFRITQIRRSGNDILVTFPARAGKLYQLEASADLLDGFPFVVTTTARITSDALLELTDAGAAAAPTTRRFYRLVVLP